MRNFLSTIIVLLSSASAFADGVMGAVVDPDTRILTIGVSHTGCSRASFNFKLVSCAQSQPAQCVADIKAPKRSGEVCQQEHEYVVRYNVDQLGLGNKPGTTLTIRGENQTAVTILLPVLAVAPRQ